MFFLKIAPYQSTPKILYIVKGLKGTKKENLNTPTLPILSNSFFIKIDPCRIEFAMMIPCPHGFGNVVAWGHNLCLPLQSQNWEFDASSGENCPTANKKS
jgi:hypothetical protein